MASWLKAAEDLFEVVDRRAKLVAGDKPDEVPVPAKGSNGRGSQTKRARARGKKKQLTDKAFSAIDNEREQTVLETSESQEQLGLGGNIPSISIENSEINPGVANSRVDSNELHKVDNDGSVTETSVLGTADNEAKPVGEHVDTETCNDVEATASNLNGEPRLEEFGDIPVPSNDPVDVKVVNDNPSVDLNRNMMSEDAGTFKNVELSRSQTPQEDTPTKADSQSKGVDLINEPDVKNKQHQVQENVNSAAKVQEQLDEAQGLLKIVISTGQSKEARLAKA